MPPICPKKQAGGKGASRRARQEGRPVESKHFQLPPREMSREDFLARFVGVYEHSPWIAEELYRRGLSPAEDTPEGLGAAMAEVLSQADQEAKLQLIRAHPDLAGRAAVAGD